MMGEGSKIAERSFALFLRRGTAISMSDKKSHKKNRADQQAGQASEPTQAAGENRSASEDGEEARVRLDSNTKLILICVLCILIAVVVASGVVMAVRHGRERPSTVYTQPTTNGFVGESSTARPIASLTAPPTEPTTASPAPAGTTPSTAATTAAPSPSVSATAAPTTAEQSRETTIPSLSVNTEDFSRLAKILYAAGFLYDADQNMFYSHNDPWQRNLGYTSLYDDLAVIGDMYFDTIRFPFKYGDKSWMYQIWKGRYGITSGCEIGVYYQDRRTDNKQFYEVPTDDDPLPGLYFELSRYEDPMFTNGPLRHWWLTGFRLLDSSESDALHMKCRFYMPNREICDAFEESVRARCAEHDNLTYSRENDTIFLDWAY